MTTDNRYRQHTERGMGPFRNMSGTGMKSERVGGWGWRVGDGDGTYRADKSSVLRRAHIIVRRVSGVIDLYLGIGFRPANGLAGSLGRVRRARQRVEKLTRCKKHDNEKHNQPDYIAVGVG